MAEIYLIGYFTTSESPDFEKKHESAQMGSLGHYAYDSMFLSDHEWDITLLEAGDSYNFSVYKITPKK